MTKFRCFTKILFVISFVCAPTADGCTLTKQDVQRTKSSPTEVLF